jgi:cytochrome b subunit of formate dehydrogenase
MLGDMYQDISIYALLITIIFISLSYIIRPMGFWKHPLRSIVHICTLPFIEQKLSFAGVIRKLVYMLALLSFIILAVTGFYPTLILGEHISGWLIIIHATFAPILAICLAVLAVMWSGRCRFTGKDWPWFQRFIERVTLVKINSEVSDNNSDTWQKIGFWLIILLALPLALSMVLSMLPYFGTYWQDLFLFIHRYTALVFAIVVLVHTHLIIRAQFKR